MMRRSRYFFLSLAIVLMALASAGQAQTIPVLDPIPDTSVTEGEILVLTVTAVDPDGLVPAVSAPVLPANAQFDDNGDGSGTLQFSPNFIQAGVYNIIFYASDIDGSDSAEVQITVVEAGNQSPVLFAIGPQTIVEGVTLTITVSAADPDSTVPQLSVSDPLPANAAFVDNGDGTGTFTFTPDETQYGDGSADTLVTFFAGDGIATVSEEVTITVTGPNEAPVLADIPDQEVTEGQTLIVDVSATDANGTIPMLRSFTLPENAELLDNGDGTGEFSFTPSFVQAGIYAVIIEAYDGALTDADTVEIIVAEAGNQAPVFTPIDTQTVSEGGLLEFTVTAVDPEGEAVTLSTQESLPANSSFDAASGQFSFSPDLTQGQAYAISFFASDSISESDPFQVATLVVDILVEEVDFPPELTAIGGRSMNEGEWLRIGVTGSDPEETYARLAVMSEPTDSLEAGSYRFVDFGDGTGLFEFFADFDFIETGSRLLRFTFYASDTIDVDSETVVLTVYDVVKDDNDPGLADIISIADGYWDGSADGFSILARITNDSAIGAASTGFSWNQDWIRCDSLRVHSSLQAADYQTSIIFNDSLMLYIGFVFFDSTYLDSGTHDYFTAYFSHDTTGFNIDSAWTDFSEFLLDSSQVGSTGDFVFDYRLRSTPMSSASKEDWLPDATAVGTYVPLFQSGIVREADDSVSLAVFDETAGRRLTAGDTIFVDGTDRRYRLLVEIENDRMLPAVDMGLTIASSDGATWTYDPQSGGLGAVTQAVTPITGSRLMDHLFFWPESNGLTVSEIEIDGQLQDTFYLGGAAAPGDTLGLPAGLADPQLALTFIPVDLPAGEVRRLCFDSASNAAGNGWRFIDSRGVEIVPSFGGRLCFPVTSIAPTGTGDETPAQPNVYRLWQNYPNPFNPTTTIRFALGKSGPVRLTVYNILGQTVRVLVDGDYEAGDHEVVWNGRDRDGRAAASGIYLYRISSEGLTESRKMILVR